jgi:hypothetical protein
VVGLLTRRVLLLLEHQLIVFASLDLVFVMLCS